MDDEIDEQTRKEILLNGFLGTPIPEMDDEQINIIMSGLGIENISGQKIWL